MWWKFSLDFTSLRDEATSSGFLEKGLALTDEGAASRASTGPPAKAGVGALVGGAVLYNRGRLGERLRMTPAASVLRTNEVRSGTLERTLRLTGSTAAGQGFVVRRAARRHGA